MLKKLIAFLIVLAMVMAVGAVANAGPSICFQDNIGRTWKMDIKGGDGAYTYFVGGMVGTSYPFDGTVIISGSSWPMGVETLAAGGGACGVIYQGNMNSSSLAASGSWVNLCTAGTGSWSWTKITCPPATESSEEEVDVEGPETQ